MPVAFVRIVLQLAAIALITVYGFAQAGPYPGGDLHQMYSRLLTAIQNMPIFDHHAHPGFADDPDVDAMAAPPGSAALRERDNNPELISAAKALFAYPYADLSPEHAHWLVEKKAALKKQYSGPAYFDMILDQLKVEQSVANRAMMADYLDPRRFVWVFFADSLMWPLDNSQMRARNPEMSRRIDEYGLKGSDLIPIHLVDNTDQPFTAHPCLIREPDNPYTAEAEYFNCRDQEFHKEMESSSVVAMRLIAASIDPDVVAEARRAFAAR